MFGLKLLIHSAFSLLSYAGPGSNEDIMPQIGANTYDILRSEILVLTKEAVASLEARLK